MPRTKMEKSCAPAVLSGADERSQGQTYGTCLTTSYDSLVDRGLGRRAVFGVAIKTRGAGNGSARGANRRWRYAGFERKVLLYLAVRGFSTAGGDSYIRAARRSHAAAGWSAVYFRCASISV